MGGKKLAYHIKAVSFIRLALETVFKHMCGILVI